MLKFDADSIYRKELEMLQQDPDWSVVANNSVITALLKSTAEAISETARYSEYLFKESKWDTAQNISSILSMAGLLGYKPKRKISAEGSIYVSADSRLCNVGKTIRSSVLKDFPSIGDTFTPAWSKADIQIDDSCTIVDSLGRSYVALQTVNVSNSPLAKVNIIQGRKKSIFINLSTIRSIATKSLLDPYLYIPVKIDFCENAGKVTSKKFFRVHLNYKNGAEKEYRIVDSLLFSSAMDNDVEVYNDLYSRSLFYLKFNNDKSRGSVLDISSTTNISGIRVDYIESLGSEGNTLNLYENFIITNSKNANTTRFYGTNIEPIIGGADEEEPLEIKTNAPKHYIESYTTGTKEAYETAIKNITFPIKSYKITPTRVQVYGGHITNNGLLQPVTCVSFISENLDDLLEELEEETLSKEDKTDLEDLDKDRVYLKIEETLNYYLSRLKAPQDTFKFVPPEFVPFAVGVNCSISKDNIGDLRQIESNIQESISKSWSSISEERDFGRSFYTSSIIKDVLNNNPEIIAADIEVEAIKKLKWTSAHYQEPPFPEGKGTTIFYHTCRIPFSFNKLFLGSKSIKGFKDYRSGSSYVMRIDFMYKKPEALTRVSSDDYHVSIFIEDSNTVEEIEEDITNYRPRNYTSFYLKQERSGESNAIWDVDRMKDSEEYSVIKTSDPLRKSYQYRYKKKVYTDNDFRALINTPSNTVISTYETDLGAVDDYLIYYSAKYEESSTGEIGDGWIEFTFDPVYTLLETFALYDPELKYKLQKCPLSLLKCETSTKEQINEDAFAQFVSVAADYIDIYVSMRPVDSDLCTTTEDVRDGSVVLHIDSQDKASSTSTIGNLTTSKEPRMISVTCEYKD